MHRLFQPRAWFLLVAWACAGLLGYAYWVQYQLFLEPCPLCIFQRVAFLFMGAVALVAAIHGPERTGARIYGALVALGAAAGAAIAGWHIHIQNLPPDEVPECGPGLNYLLDTMPVWDAVASAFRGSGDCAVVDWTFLGLSMPWWTLFWYVGLGLVTLWVVFRKGGAPR